jgi:hypothetical protein
MPTKVFTLDFAADLEPLTSANSLRGLLNGLFRDEIIGFRAQKLIAGPRH